MEYTVSATDLANIQLNEEDRVKEILSFQCDCLRHPLDKMPLRACWLYGYAHDFLINGRQYKGPVPDKGEAGKRICEGPDQFYH